MRGVSYKAAMDGRPTKYPLCPNCGEPMKLVRVIAGAGGLAPLNVFACAPCGVYYSEARAEPPAAAANGT